MPRAPRPWFYRQTGWWMCWLNGKKIKLAKGKANLKAAEERLLELRLEILRHPPADGRDATVASVIEAYLAYAKPRLADATLVMRTTYLQSFAEAHGWRRLSDAKPYQLIGWLDDHPGWASDWTKHTAIQCVQTAFNWAAKTRLTAENPFRGASHHVGLPLRDMTPSEFQAILRATSGRHRKRPTPAARFRQVLVFLWYTGCRPQEARRLKWSQVDVANAVIVLAQHKTIRLQRQPRPRIVPLHPVVVKLLESIRRREESEHVFLTHRKTPWTKDALALRLARARKLGGVSDEVKLYGVRHSFGTRGILHGCDIKTLSTLMGHTTTRMTEHYCHVAGQREHLAAAMRLINGRRPSA